LFPQWFASGKRSGPAGKYGSPGTDRSEQAAAGGEFYRLQERSKFHSRDADDVCLTNDIAARNPSGSLATDDDGPLHSISVKRDIEWSSSRVRHN
jgi:hypothetical protein